MQMAVVQWFRCFVGSPSFAFFLASCWPLAGFLASCWLLAGLLLASCWLLPGLPHEDFSRKSAFWELAKTVNFLHENGCFFNGFRCFVGSPPFGASSFLASCWPLAGLFLASCWRLAGVLLAPCWRLAGLLLASCWPLANLLLASCWPLPRLLLTSCWLQASPRRSLWEICFWEGSRKR